MQDITDIVKHLSSQAKKQLLKVGKLEPKMYFLILYPGQKTAVYFPVPVSKFFENSKLKQSIPWYAQTAWLSKKLDSPPGIELKAVCIMSDTFFSVYKVDKTMSEHDALEIMKEAPLPSKDPKRIEAINFSICEKEKSHSYVMPYKRIGKKIVFDETKENESARVIGGWMAELFPKKL